MGLFARVRESSPIWWGWGGETGLRFSGRPEQGGMGQRPRLVRAGESPRLLQRWLGSAHTQAPGIA